MADYLKELPPGSESVEPNEFNRVVYTLNGKAGSAVGANFFASNPPTGPYGASTGITVYPTGVNLQAEGADMSGGTDASAALTKALTDLPSGGGTIYVPPGSVLFTNGAPSITKPIFLKGAGAGAGDVKGGAGITTKISEFITPSGTADLLSLAAHGCTFEDIAFRNTNGGNPTLGTGLKMATGGHHTRINRCLFYGFYNLVDVAVGTQVKITNSDFFDPVNYGVFYHNLTPSGDEGDPPIGDGCLFGVYYTSRTPVAAIRWESGGGLRVENAKINGGGISPGHWQNGVDVEVADGVNTSNIHVVGCSIEATSLNGVLVKEKGTTGTLLNVVIVGNEIGVGMPNVINLQSATPGNIHGVHISGNTFPASGGIYALGVADISIGPNVWPNPASWLFNLDTGCTNARIDLAGQVVQGDSKLLVWDNTVGNTSHGPFGQNRWDDEREIPSTLSSVTYTTLWRIAMPQNAAEVIEVTLNGFVGTRTNFLVKQTRGALNTTGPATVTLIGTDVAMGTVIDVLFDVASVSGEVQIKVRLNAGAGGTDVSGRASLHIDGPIYQIRKGP